MADTSSQAAFALQQRLQDRLSKLSPRDPRLRELAFRIGLRIEADAKTNIRNQGIIDRGALINSIKTVVEQKGDGVEITVGSFGVPYAAMNEFGGRMNRTQIRAMFASMRRRGGTKRSSKKIITFAKDMQSAEWKARPYLRPAFLENIDNALMEIRSYFRGS